MTGQTKREIRVLSDDEKSFVTAMHRAAQMLLSDDSLLSQRPLNYQAYYTVYERYNYRALQIEARILELQSEEQVLINDQRRLDKVRDDIKQRIGKAVKDEQRGQPEKIEKEKSVLNHFPQSHNADI